MHEVSPGHALFVQKGSWLANEVNVTIDAKWGGFKNLFGGEGGFIIRTEGQGTVVFACYGALEVWNLQAGQGDHHRHRAHGRLRGHGADGDAQGQRRRPGAELGRAVRVSCSTSPAPAGCGRRRATPTELLGWIQSFVGTGNSSGTSIGGAFGGILGRD